MLYEGKHGCVDTMNTFEMHLQSTSQYECISEVSSFVAEDASGSFGIMAGHSHFMTALIFGLASFRNKDATWEYVALPGALVSFDNNRLVINTRHYIRSSDYSELSEKIQQQLAQEEENLKKLKRSLHQMEEQMLRRMWEMRRSGGELL